jgi:hypothetical protein
MPPGGGPPNPVEHEPFWAGRSIIDVAAMDPVLSAVPSAVTHNPTTKALALAAAVRVYVVAADVCTVRVVGAGTLGTVAVPSTGRELSTVNAAPLTAVTLPEAPSPKSPPPAPGGRVLPDVGIPAGGVGSPLPPGARAPGIRDPPTVQRPSTAGEISTEAAATGPAAAVGATPRVPEAGGALRAWTHAPTTTSESLAATVLVNVVLAE